MISTLEPPNELGALRSAPDAVDGSRWVSYGMFRRIADGTLLPDIIGVRAFEPFSVTDLL